VALADGCALGRELGGEADFYFVHSYAVHPQDASVGVGTCTYGEPFAAVVHLGNVAGVQFHPEKSHRAGLRLLENFLSADVDAPC
jgi:glutamine amidotransferase